MWDIENTTPFTCHGCFLKDHMARSLWCLFLKAGFGIRPDKAPLFLSAQPPVLVGPQFDGPALVADSDICPPKPLCDFTLTGHAQPPPGKGRDGWPVTARIGAWRKTLHVLPAAVWRDGAVRVSRGDAEPASLGWDSAAPGPQGPEGPENPQGPGPGQDGPLPRLVAPGETHLSGQPVAFAPLARSRPARQRLGGTYDARWQRQRAPLLPADLDPHFWQSAPRDQWLDPATLPGAEVELTGVRPEPLRFRLPQIGLEMATRFSGRWTQQEPRLQTVAMDIDRMQLTLVWAGYLPIAAAQNDILVERSFIALRDHKGFAASAHDASRFSTGIAQETA